MTASHADIIERSSEKVHIWVNDMAAELGTEDRQAACSVLRRHVSAGELEDVMHALPEAIRALLL